MNDKTCSTRNIALAAFILAKGGPIPAITGKRGAATFTFDDPEEKFGWTYEEFKSDVPIPVQQYLWAQRELRAQLDRALGPRTKGENPKLPRERK